MLQTKAEQSPKVTHIVALQNKNVKTICKNSFTSLYNLKNSIANKAFSYLLF